MNRSRDSGLNDAGVLLNAENADTNCVADGNDVVSVCYKDSAVDQVTNKSD